MSQKPSSADILKEEEEVIPTNKEHIKSENDDNNELQLNEHSENINWNSQKKKTRTKYTDMMEEPNLESQNEMNTNSMSLLNEDLNQSDEINYSHIRDDDDDDALSNVHIFYYAWYRNKQNDGEYKHWNHIVLPHWTQAINQQYPQIGKAYNPDDDEIGANYFPLRGLYSSSSKHTIQTHLKEIKQHGRINAIVVSWWGIDGKDEQGENQEKLMPVIFDVAEQLSMKIIFHMEPYNGRSALSTKNDLSYIIQKYGHRKAFYRIERNGKWLPFLYVYDSYLIPAKDWATILSSNGAHTIRGTDLDSVMIGLFVEQSHETWFIDSHFDGFYTYFAATGFTYGSTISNWDRLQQFATNHNKIFIPSIGPGYVDTRIRPWNKQNERNRESGSYYDRMFSKAIELNPKFISITSYNEWHEGTQIEPCKNGKQNKKNDYVYMDYGNDPYFYLKKTFHWVTQYKDKTSE